MAWNPKNFAWEEQGALIDALGQGRPATIEWSCGNVKEIPVGSHVFLIRLGSDPRGLIASGFTTAEVIEKTHWSAAKARAGKMARFVKIHFDVLARSPLIRRFELDNGIFKGFSLHYS